MANTYVSNVFEELKVVQDYISPEYLNYFGHTYYNESDTYQICCWMNQLSLFKEFPNVQFVRVLQ